MPTRRDRSITAQDDHVVVFEELAHPDFQAI
jgi:hypothetical protein